jgi:hypothetical protein
MDKSGIDKALVFAGELNNVPNEFLLKEIPSHKDRLYGVASFHPPHENGNDLPKLRSAIESGHVVAVKFYLGYDHWYPTDNRIYEVLAYLSEMGIPAIFHCGDCLNTMKGAKLKYAHPLSIDEVAVDFPDQKIVIAHMGYPWHRDSAEVVYKNKNVFVDISGFVYGGFGIKNEQSFRKVLDDFIEVAGGTDQMLFGTDSPISNQDDYVSVASKILPESIFFENPKKVFNL